jgi:excisionase family DNA binding protein
LAPSLQGGVGEGVAAFGPLPSGRVSRKRQLSRFAPPDPFEPFAEISMKPALSTSEAAAWLGISKSTLIRAVRRGEIQAAFWTPGRHLRFTADDLQRIKQQLQIKTRRVA